MIETPTYAPWSRRVLAYVIDQWLLMPLVALFFLPKQLRGPAILAFTLVWIWSTMIHQGRRGQSIGRRLTHTKLVDQYTGQPLGVGRNVVRGLVHTIDFVPFCIGFFRPLWNSKLQTWTDEYMATVVIDTRAQAQGWKPLPTTPSIEEVPDAEAA